MAIWKRRCSKERHLIHSSECTYWGRMSLMSESSRGIESPSRLHVILEPRAGHTLQEILLTLEQADAMEIDQISAKFVSAEITPSSVPSLEAIAFVDAYSGRSCHSFRSSRPVRPIGRKYRKLWPRSKPDGDCGQCYLSPDCPLRSVSDSLLPES